MKMFYDQLDLRRRRFLLHCGSKTEVVQAPCNQDPQRMYKKSFYHSLTRVTEENEMSATVLQPNPSPEKESLGQVTMVTKRMTNESARD
jgi:hypothetical protein